MVNQKSYLEYTQLQRPTPPGLWKEFLEEAEANGKWEKTQCEFTKGGLCQKT